MMCKIVKIQKLMCQYNMRSTKSKKKLQFYIIV